MHDALPALENEPAAHEAQEFQFALEYDPALQREQCAARRAAFRGASAR